MNILMNIIFRTKPSPLEDDVKYFPNPVSELWLDELFEGRDWISGSALLSDPWVRVRPRPRPRTGLGRPKYSPEKKPLDGGLLKLFL